MAGVEKGQRRGFLKATGRKKTSPSHHMVYEYECLACGDGISWKRANDNSGISCGCIKQARFRIWVDCFMLRLPREEILAEFRRRYSLLLEETAAAIEAKEKGQQEPDESHRHVTEVGAELPVTVDPKLFAWVLKAEKVMKSRKKSTEPKSRKKPTERKARKSKSKAAETPCEEHLAENPTNCEPPSTDSCEPLSE